MEQEAQRAYPRECCGVIFGRLDGQAKYAESLRPSENSFEEGEQYHRFRITAEQMLGAELYARREGLDIVGFYHSHPDCPAVPSEYDRSHALPVYSYIIVSCVKGRAEDLTCQQLGKDTDYTRFAKEEIIIRGV